MSLVVTDSRPASRRFATEALVQSRRSHGFRAVRSTRQSSDGHRVVECNSRIERDFCRGGALICRDHAPAWIAFHFPASVILKIWAETTFLLSIGQRERTVTLCGSSQVCRKSIRVSPASMPYSAPHRLQEGVSKLAKCRFAAAPAKADAYARSTTCRHRL